MTPARALLIYLSSVMIGGALLAPWLHHLTQWAALHVPALESLAANPFHRFVNRSMLGLALIGLWPFFRGLGVRRWADVGLAAPRSQWRGLGSGFTFGFVSLACIAGIAIAAGGRTPEFDHTAYQIARMVFKATSAAIVVAILEEILFRGGLFGGLRRAHHWVTALLVSSAVYALVHFFSRPASPETVHWHSGLELLPLMLRGFGEIEMLVPGFFNLALAGMILAYAFHRTGNLCFSIGLHAGWIFWLKSYGFFTREVPGANTWLWGTRRLIDGWLAFLVLALAGLVLYLFLRTRGGIDGQNAGTGATSDKMLA